MLSEDEVYLHVGYHKTGTTFLQQRVFPALEKELDRVITPSCAYIAEAMLYCPKVFREQLQTSRRGVGQNKVIISAETLSGRGDGNPMWDEMEIAERLYETFEHNGRVLAVVRSPLDYIMSLYVFRVVTRGLERRDLDTYLREKFNATLRRKLDYYRLLSRYIELFSSDRVLILPFEQLRDDYARFMASLYGFLGVKTANVAPHPVNPGYRNRKLVNAHRRLNTPISVLISKLRCQGRMSQSTYEHLMSGWFTFKRVCVQPVLMRMFHNGPEIEFPADWRCYMESEFRESNRRLQDIMDEDLGALGWSL